MAAIVSGDVLWKFSVAGAASAGNATAGSATTTWQGKYMSSTAWAGGVADDLFADITGAQNAASQVDYVCLFIHVTNTANAYQNAVVSIQSETAGGASIALAVDTTAASAANSGTAQAITATTSTTVPGASVTGLTYGSSATLGTIGAPPTSQCRAFWIRRTAANNAAVSDGVVLQVTGDTGAL
jgi:hypothetical protein